MLQPPRPGLSLWEATSPSGHSGPRAALISLGSAAGRRVLVLRTVAIVLSSMFTPNLPSFHHQEPGKQGPLESREGAGLTSGLVKAWQSQAHVTGGRGKPRQPSGDSVTWVSNPNNVHTYLPIQQSTSGHGS